MCRRRRRGRSGVSPRRAARAAGAVLYSRRGRPGRAAEHFEDAVAEEDEFRVRAVRRGVAREFRTRMDATRRGCPRAGPGDRPRRTRGRGVAARARVGEARSPRGRGPRGAGRDARTTFEPASMTSAGAGDGGADDEAVEAGEASSGDSSRRPRARSLDATSANISAHRSVETVAHRHTRRLSAGLPPRGGAGASRPRRRRAASTGCERGERRARRSTRPPREKTRASVARTPHRRREDEPSRWTPSPPNGRRPRPRARRC